MTVRASPALTAWVALAASVPAFGLIYLVCLAIAWHGAHVNCLRLHEQTGYPTRMTGSMFGGSCYIDVNGQWIPGTRYRSGRPARVPS